ncbi:hypothetical protein [Methylomonas methanica]|uniref:Uncharacterized protein n=1 Tax=Methylomonas methanica TaxID=421 RepID=A0A177MN62_METMH|nr:hypothetical protein [Methylomonas methanica]OAI06753.1 hypothetical protein A1332_10885 [Methylomonas methanica]
MATLFIHEDAEDDLEEIWSKDIEAAARVTVLLEELKGNDDLLDRLTQHDFGSYGTADFHVSKWIEQWNKGNNLWRLKIWDLEDNDVKYRIVYAFIPAKKRYHVLGVVPREFNYAANNELTIRILNAYQNL